MSTSESQASYLYVDWHSSSGAQVEHTESETDEYDFLSFLATVQAFQIEIIPIVWETGRGLAGTGGTARVEQARLNLDTSFAFKTYDRRNRRERDIFRTAINEVKVLSQRFVRQHDNIAQLQGICWDISREDDRPWPVLVFEMSSLGDLHCFLRQEGKDMTIDQRLWLCVDIGMAIMDMHTKQIVHGDIKPANVLVFRSESDRYTAKVIDFGYSSRYIRDDERLVLPISAPWNAPENDGRSSGWTPSQAAKADFYCFGLLCVWLLSPCCHEVQTASAGGEVLRSIKENLTIHTQQLLLQMDVREDIKGALCELFNSSLCQDPQERGDECLFRFVRKLDPERADKHDFYVMDLDEEFGMRTTRFEIHDTANQLYSTDYRVRAYIAQCLLKNPLSSAFTASQAALCYHLGFGVARDEAKAQEILARSKKRQKLFKKALSWLEHQRGVAMASTIHSLREMGLLFRSDFTNLYLEHEKLDEAEATLTREMNDLVGACGADHELVKISKEMLTMIYGVKGQWEKAEKLDAELMESYETELGADSIITLTSKGNLARALASQGKLIEAEKLTSELVTICQSQLGADASLTLYNMDNLATILAEQGRGAEAEKIALQVTEIYKAKLGEDHPDTLTSISTLSSALLSQRRFQEAEELEVQALKSRKAHLGANHQDTLASMNSLAIIWKLQGKDTESLKLLEECVQSRQEVFGPLHPETISSVELLEHWREEIGSSPIDSMEVE